MSDKGGSLWAVASAAGAGGLFLGLWLALGIPLPWSAAAGIAGYGALWALLSGAAKERRAPSMGDFVDKDLAKRAIAKARQAADSLDATSKGIDARDPLLPKLAKLSRLLRAIAVDVEADPKDAAAAFAFVATQGDASARAARLALQIEARGGSREQVADARERVGAALDGLIAAHERHLESLQEDNLVELQSELETLEATLGLDADFEAELRSRPASGGKASGSGKASGGGKAG